ncbi:uncharacterized protein MONBRDRAFT_9671 [Monosiga brevicollis MX1]|uniref:C2 domain-containing protein n=1 Tax=Monosiga brevicollis TaxID=81824 RepID=A9V412_MONBE|nr:uncharacterized protein MONBRDRAFT_9671 [Monosiga brevicollis MX1]EDQ87901.1 predicted protein [Monosiga brevicollis MX1]|eukprot:XP_001747434.1 hypothetical protein [Monosiga brevicollis MX1]
MDAPDGSSPQKSRTPQSTLSGKGSETTSTSPLESVNPAAPLLPVASRTLKDAPRQASSVGPASDHLATITTSLPHEEPESAEADADGALDALIARGQRLQAELHTFAEELKGDFSQSPRTVHDIPYEHRHASARSFHAAHSTPLGRESNFDSDTELLVGAVQHSRALQPDPNTSLDSLPLSDQNLLDELLYRDPDLDTFPATWPHLPGDAAVSAALNGQMGKGISSTSAPYPATHMTVASDAQWQQESSHGLQLHHNEPGPQQSRSPRSASSPKAQRSSASAASVTRPLEPSIRPHQIADVQAGSAINSTTEFPRESVARGHEPYSDPVTLAGQTLSRPRFEQLLRLDRLAFLIADVDAGGLQPPPWTDAGREQIELEFSLPAQGILNNVGEPDMDAHIVRVSASACSSDELLFNRRVDLRVQLDAEILEVWLRSVVVFRLVRLEDNRDEALESNSSDSSSSSSSSSSSNSSNSNGDNEMDGDRGTRSRVLERAGPRHAAPRRQLLAVASLNLATLLQASGAGAGIELPLTNLHASAVDGCQAVLHASVQFDYHANEQPEAVGEAPGSQAPPLTASVSRESTTPTILHVLLQATDVRGLQPRPISKLPHNLYLRSRLGIQPEAVTSPVSWSTDQPRFQHQHLLPVRYSPKLVQDLQTALAVLEIWDRAGSDDGTDRLIGLVKLPLHDFYLAFRDVEVARAILRAELPVFAANDFQPIVDPISGSLQGRIKIALAAGSQRQVALLLRHRLTPRLEDEANQEETNNTDASQSDLDARRRARVLFTTDGPRQVDDRSGSGNKVSGTASNPTLNSTMSIDETGDAVADELDTGLSRTIVTMHLEALQDLDLFQHSLYGEADCFIEYTWPESNERAVEQLLLRSIKRSGNLHELDGAVPALGPRQFHSLVSERAEAAATMLVAALSGIEHRIECSGVELHLVQRRYAPSQSDQRVAVAVLQSSQIRALLQATCRARPGTTMQQTWRLPLLSTHHQSRVGTLILSLHCRQEPLTLPEAASAALKQVRQTGFTSEATRLDMPRQVVRVRPTRLTGLGSAMTALANEVRRKELLLAAELGGFLYLRLALAGRAGHVEPQTERSALPDMSAYARCSPWHSTAVSSRAFAPQFADEVVFEGAADHVLVQTWLALQGRPSAADLLLAETAVPIRRMPQDTGFVRMWRPLVRPTGTPEVHHVELASPEDRLGSAQGQAVGAVELSIQAAPVVGSPPTPVLSPPAFLDRHVQLQLIVEEALLPNRVRTSDGDGAWQWLDRPQLEFFVRYTLPDGRLQESRPCRAQARARQSGVVCNLQHRGAFSLILTPTAAAALVRQLEVQLWVRTTNLRSGHEPPSPHHQSSSATGCQMSADTVDETWLGSAYLDAAPLLHGSFTVSDLLPLVTPNAREMSGAQVRVHAILDLLESGARVPHGTAPDTATTDVHGTSVRDRPLAPHLIGTQESDVQSAGVMCSVAVTRALHLQLGSHPLPRAYETYVSYAMGSEVQCTQVVDAGACPTWNHERMLSIPFSAGDATCNQLLFKVWCRSMSATPSQELLLGTAAVNLEPLQYGLRQLSGWYHVFSESGHQVGQLCLTVQPTQPVPPPPRVQAVPELRYQAYQRPDFVPPEASSKQVPLLEDNNVLSSSFLRRQLQSNLEELSQLGNRLGYSSSATAGHTSPQQHLDDCHPHQGPELAQTDSQQVPAFLSTGLHSHDQGETAQVDNPLQRARNLLNRLHSVGVPQSYSSSQTHPTQFAAPPRHSPALLAAGQTPARGADVDGGGINEEVDAWNTTVSTEAADHSLADPHDTSQTEGNIATIESPHPSNIVRSSVAAEASTAPPPLDEASAGNEPDDQATAEPNTSPVHDSTEAAHASPSPIRSIKRDAQMPSEPEGGWESAISTPLSLSPLSSRGASPMPTNSPNCSAAAPTAAMAQTAFEKAAANNHPGQVSGAEPETHRRSVRVDVVRADNQHFIPHEYRHQPIQGMFE